MDIDSATHLILTLDPNKFAEKKQTCLSIGYLRSFIPRVSLLKQSSPVIAHRLNYDAGRPARKPDNQPLRFYPASTKAFLYYSMSPDKPRIAGELRLRVVSTDDPASFESGSDLLLPNDRLWSRSLYSLSKYNLPLYEKLREERLVPDDLDTVISTLALKRLSYRRSNVLYTLNDTFIIDFSLYNSSLFVITEQGAEKLILSHTFSDHRVMRGYAPYTGAYTNLLLSRLLFSLICRKCLGSI